MRKTSTRFDGLNLFGFPVRADTAVRPYAEDLSLNRHSRVREKSCRGRLPRLPARHDNRNAKRASTEACPYAELVNIAQTKSNKPSHQRDARWDVEREAPTTRANCQSVNQSKIKVPVARANTAVRPYT